MRKTVVVLAFTLVAALGAFVPARAAAYVSDAKVVIIVGAVHGATDEYRRRGDAAAAVADDYTPNVVKVYSPNATWKKVKAATAGANIVIYMGHGNGWPSPYAYDPNYTTKDGFGLNATSGDGDYNNRYYGEPYVEQLDLAPNAIVLLHHLCYASGNSEPGDAEPTVTRAKKRVENYAAGFLRSPARAVIADGHMGAANYLRALFTTNQTILSMWRGMPNANGNEFSFASGRNSGFTAYMDPDSATKGFYRSLVTKPTITTSQVTGTVAATDGVPSTFTVPGRAEVIGDGAELLDSTGQPLGTTLSTGTRLAVVDNPLASAGDGTGLLQVAGLDDTGITGYVRVDELAPRDSTAPIVLAAAASAGAISPNGDGKADETTVSASFTESVEWRVTFRNGSGAVVGTRSGSGRDAAAAWDGLDGGTALPDGAYTYEIQGTDAWENTGSKKTGTIRIDTTGPTLSGMPADGDPVPWFAPNGDGYRDTVSVGGSVSEAGDLVLRVRDASNAVIRSQTVKVSKAGPFTLTWDGRTDEGTAATDGRYALQVTPRDAVWNSGASATAPATLVNLVGHVAASKSLIYPQDRDGLVDGTTLSFRLDREATVTWTIRNAKGTVVDTLLDGEVLPAGTHKRGFYGKRLDGTMLPVGVYRSVLQVSDGTLSASQSATFEMNAFRVSVSDTTPRRGQKITVTVVSAEPLADRPRLYVTQPGKATYSFRMKTVATRTYRTTFMVKTGGKAGTLTLLVKQKDTGGGRNSSQLKLKLS